MKHMTMKKNFYTKTLLFVSLTLLSLTGWGQIISENFNESTTSATSGGTGMPTSYSTGNYVLTSGTWALTTAIYNNNSSNYHSSPSALQLRSVTGSQAISPTIATGGVGTLTFWAALTSGSGTSLQVNISVNGGGYTPVTGSPFSLTTTTTQFSVPINNSGSNIQLQFYRTSGTVVIDDVITTAVA